MIRLQNQAKLRSYRITPKYKFRYQILCSNYYEHALSIVKHDGNNKWAESIKLETDQQHDCDTYRDMGKASSPEACELILSHLVFDMKHDGRHRAILVADGHLTNTPLSSVYSGVVSLQIIILVLFVAKLNQLDSWGDDIRNAHLEKVANEKVYIKDEREFGPLEGHTLFTNKALHGLRTSGLRWHERLRNCLRDMGCEPHKIEPGI